MSRIFRFPVIFIVLTITGCAFAPYRGVKSDEQFATLKMYSNLKKSNWNFLNPGHTHVFALFDNNECNANTESGQLVMFQTPSTEPVSVKIPAEKPVYLLSRSINSGLSCTNVVKFIALEGEEYSIVQNKEGIGCQIVITNSRLSSNRISYFPIPVTHKCRVR